MRRFFSVVAAFLPSSSLLDSRLIDGSYKCFFLFLFCHSNKLKQLKSSARLGTAEFKTIWRNDFSELFRVHMVAINYICLTIIVCSLLFHLPRFLQLFARQQINSHALKCTHTQIICSGWITRSLALSRSFSLCVTQLKCILI